MNWHEVIDRRSLELDQLIAEKLRRDPALLKVAHDNLDRWMSKHGPHPTLLEWKELLNTRSFEQVLDLLCSWDEEARWLRQSSPFVGILTEEERWAIFAKYEQLRP